MSEKEQTSYNEALKRIERCRKQGKKGTRLILDGLDLTQLPPEIAQLHALERLDADYNRLVTVPDSLRNLHRLERLFLQSNRLSDLPEWLAELTSLRTLALTTNSLLSLPESLCALTNVTELYVGRNKLTTVSGDVGRLQGLQTLLLNNNDLTALPPSLGRLTNLRILELANNSLEKLPPELGDLPHLEELYLHGNPRLGLPAEVLGPDWVEVHARRVEAAVPRAIVDYYFARQFQGEAPMQEVRLLLVGRGRVGKTSLLKALRGEGPDAYEPETPGITVLPLDLDCARGSARAHAWDFGGQEFLHGTHQIFLSERCVYALVLEGRDGNWEMETDYWLRFIQSFGGDSPVIVALNKYDLHAFSVDRYRLKERCPQIVDFVETDAFTGLGVAKLRSLLEGAVNAMDHVWVGVPRKWHRVKSELSRMPENFLDYKDYQRLCARLDVRHESEQDSLAANLHRLGIALNFRDHHRLRDTSVLKPQWVTEGIYGVLRHAQKRDCHGIIERSWLAEALPSKNYPSDKLGFVLELMEKFEVAFPLATKISTDQPERWLVPELLPEVQPAAFEQFRAPGVQRLRYSYPEAIPPGLLPRLIVRTHEMSEGQPEWRWRSGVVLQWGESLALVRLDRSERRTDVAVIGGSNDARQSLFDVIRAHLTVLHGNVRAIEQVEIREHPDTWVSAEKLRLLERKGRMETEEETRDNRLTTVAVTPTLDKVESMEARVAEGPTAQRRFRLFVSYAHADEKKIKSLSTHLTILGQRGYIQPWDDKQLVAGEQWEERIMEELGRADIVLILYSTASRASTFIQQKEAPAALKRAEERSCTVIVVPLDRNDWDVRVPLEQSLKKLQTATWNAKPILDYTPQRKGWKEIEDAILRAVEKRREVDPDIM